MLAKEIKYTDFNGVEQADTYHFHLSQTELLEMRESREGGLEEFLKQIVETEDRAQMIAMFKHLILTSVGEKSLDGKSFVKNDDIRKAFEQTAAYNALFMQLATDDKASAEFINGVIPAELRDLPDQDKPLAPPPAPTNPV